jgi:hypothetical protein
MMGWQSIDSAPKDGTVIAAMRQGAGHSGISIIFWDGETWAGYTCEEEKRLVRFMPTHWYPIPAVQQ